MDKGIYVATLDELSEAPRVIRGNNHNIVVFEEQGECYAVDNRCPHMGFPLERGTVRDGILTCHWHQARFDLRSGCTFDLWADDVLKFDTWADDDKVYVAADPQVKRDVAFYKKRLIQGIEQDVGLVQAKSLLSLLETENDLSTLLDDIVGYTSYNLDQVTEGLTRLGCIANLYPNLTADVAYQGLFYAIRKLAQETASSIPHRQKDALAGADYGHSELKAWLHQWVQTRHVDGTERTLLTALTSLSDTELADIVFSVASVRLYASGGHLLESCNKVFEIGRRWPGHRKAVFGLLVNSLAQARGQEESTNWHHPVEIVNPLTDVDALLPEILLQSAGDASPGANAQAILTGDDPLVIIDFLVESLRADVSPLLLAREVCYAAAMRLARFATSN